MSRALLPQRSDLIVPPPAGFNQLQCSGAESPADDGELAPWS